MTPQPIRILHIVPDMQRNGGIQNTLMQLLRRIDRTQFQIDIAVQTPEPSDFDDEIRALGSQLLHCYPRQRPLLFAQRLGAILQQHGPYDVLHSHVAHYTGYVLLLARLFGVPMRIAHSRNDETRKWREASLPKRVYVNGMKQLLRQNATHGLAVSADAATYLFGANWQKDPRYRVLLNGFDFAPFRQSVDRKALRAELGIAPETFVIGHVGRLAPQKNHSFLLTIAEKVAAQMPDVLFLLVGDGPLRSQIVETIHAKGLEGRVHLLGVRDDVPRLMLGAFDLFLFPSLHEGFGNVLIEAQAAGLHCLMTDTLPYEAEALPALVTRLPLENGAATWAEAIMELRKTPSTLTQADALAQLEQSRYSIDVAIQQLEALYSEAHLAD